MVLVRGGRFRNKMIFLPAGDTESRRRDNGLLLCILALQLLQTAWWLILLSYNAVLPQLPSWRGAVTVESWDALHSVRCYKPLPLSPFSFLAKLYAQQSAKVDPFARSRNERCLVVLKRGNSISFASLVQG